MDDEEKLLRDLIKKLTAVVSDWFDTVEEKHQKKTHKIVLDATLNLMMASVSVSSYPKELLESIGDFIKEIDIEEFLKDEKPSHSNGSMQN